MIQEVPPKNVGLKQRSLREQNKREQQSASVGQGTDS